MFPWICLTLVNILTPPSDPATMPWVMTERYLPVTCTARHSLPSVCFFNDRYLLCRRLG